MSYKVFANGNSLPASDINNNLMNQAIAVFTDATARDAAITLPVDGQFSYLTGTSNLTKYTGAAWEDAIVPTGGLPLGGSTGQYLVKQSGTDYDSDWQELPVTTVSEQGTSRTIVAGDANSFIYSTNTITITIDDELAVGQSINFIQNTAGAITFLAGSGITINSKDSMLQTNGLYTGATITKKSVNTYYLIGDLA